MTGHICNDIRKFIPSSLQESNKSLITANGTGPCLQEEMVQLQLIDDNGMKHKIILDNCLLHPNLPVNLLSTKQLAEKSLIQTEILTNNQELYQDTLLM
jgi:hypothetical protein